MSARTRSASDISENFIGDAEEAYTPDFIETMDALRPSAYNVVDTVQKRRATVFSIAHNSHLLSYHSNNTLPLTMKIPAHTKIVIHRGADRPGRYIWSPFVTKVEFRHRLAELPYSCGAGGPRNRPRARFVLTSPFNAHL